ncbi:MAG: hypothetical protein NC414_01250 [Bacteroidales bacterium]|nr:hypothetical protein [Bacteroidales bacterium]
MEKMTAKEGMRRMIDRYKQRTEATQKKELAGLGINDYLTVFLGSTDVIHREYFMQPDGTLESTMKEHQEEILEHIQGAKNAMLQIVCGNDFELMTSGVNSLASFADMPDKNMNFYWGMDREPSTDFKLRIEVYIIK